MAIKAVRQEALRAFGFEDDILGMDAGKALPPPPVPAIVSERTLHMDRITEKLRSDIPGFLKRYFNFPDDDYPEVGGSVPHIVNLLEEMFIGGHLLAMWATDHAKSLTADRKSPEYQPTRR